MKIKLKTNVKHNGTYYSEGTELEGEIVEALDPSLYEVVDESQPVAQPTAPTQEAVKEEPKELEGEKKPEEKQSAKDKIAAVMERLTVEKH